MNWDNQSLQEVYRQYARIYNLVCGWIFLPGRKRATEVLECKPGDRVLEVGVGTGLSLRYYPADVRVVGIDISEEMLKQARKLREKQGLAHVEALEIMDAQNMNFPDNSFDRVVAMHVATVVPDPRKFVAEMQRVCKPGGKIVLVTYFEQTETLAGKAAALVSPWLSKILGFHPNVSYVEFLKTTELKIAERFAVNLFRLWFVLTIQNDKAALKFG